MYRAVCLCALVIACVLILNAQDISGRIGGTILDSSGLTVPNAKVTITNTDRNQVVYYIRVFRSLVLQQAEIFAALAEYVR